MGKLTTHVLDTANGCPAAGIMVELWRLDGSSKVQMRVITTNADGRTTSPLLDESDIQAGEYELVFYVRSYFENRNGISASPSPFLNIVPVRFTIFDTTQNYHVPLLVSPWSYSTYRGS